MEDNASLSCLLCVQKFTYSNRRHHCRTCGVLVCDLCSTKRLHTTKTSPSTPPPGSRSSSARKPSPATPSTPPPPSSAASGSTAVANKKGMDRVCDGCFNKLTFECFLWQQAVQKVRRHQEKLAAENPELLINDVAIADNSRGVGGSGGSSLDRTRNVATEMRRALEQRGERLQQASEQSEQLRQVCGCSNKNVVVMFTLTVPPLFFVFLFLIFHFLHRVHPTSTR